MSTLSKTRGLSWVVPFLWALSGVEAQDGFFDPPVLMAEVSSPFSDEIPIVRADSLEMFLSSNRPGGQGAQGDCDIWLA